MITIIFNAKIISEKKKLAKGLLKIFNGLNNEVKMYESISGGWGKGYLPAGSYQIDSIFSKPCGKSPIKSLEPYKGDKFYWWIKLKPVGKLAQLWSKIRRTGLLIHVDNGIEGTLGCIGISRSCINLDKPFELISKAYKENNNVQVIVNYS